MKIFIALAATTAIGTALPCWKSAYGRGVGKAIHTCSDGEELDGLLCYPTCKAGFSGVGPVCW